jgi:hypothetical protein
MPRSSRGHFIEAPPYKNEVVFSVLFRFLVFRVVDCQPTLRAPQVREDSPALKEWTRSPNTTLGLKMLRLSGVLYAPLT